MRLCRTAGGCTTPPRGAKSCRSEPPPAGAIVVDAYVDSMASYLTVNSRYLLWKITNANPRIGLETAVGFSAAEAIGIALVYMLVGAIWFCYEVHNVILLLGCPSTLYSARVMRDLFKFTHNFESCSISVPGHGIIDIHNDSVSFTIKLGFVPQGAPRPLSVQCPDKPVPVIAFAAGSAGSSPEGVPEALSNLDVARTPSTINKLYQRLGFSYVDQRRLVPVTMTHRGLPIDKPVPTSIPVSQAVISGRSRALPFFRPLPRAPQPPPGALQMVERYSAGKPRNSLLASLLTLHALHTRVR